MYNIKLKNLLSEIKLTNPDKELASEISMEDIESATDKIIEIIKSEITDFENEKDIIRYYVDNDRIYDDLKKYVGNLMVRDNIEVSRNGNDILLTYKNISSLTKDEIIDYVESNKELYKYLESLIYQFYRDNIDMDTLLDAALSKIAEDKKEYSSESYRYKYSPSDLQRSVERALDEYEEYLVVDYVLEDNNFEEFVQTKLRTAPDSISEVRFNNPDKEVSTLGSVPEKLFNDMINNTDDHMYYFSSDITSGLPSNLYEFIWLYVNNKLDDEEITNIIGMAYNEEEFDRQEDSWHAADEIINTYDSFFRFIKKHGLGDIEFSKNKEMVQEIRLTAGSLEKKNKIVSYEEAGGPHGFYRYWKNPEHSDDVLYYTMADERTWTDDQEETFEVYRSTETGFALLATGLTEQDATELAYKWAIEDDNGKFVKWNMSYARFGLSI
jgi:hypothetical protein